MRTFQEAISELTVQSPRPLSPKMRQAVVKLDKTLKEYKFLCENHIDSPQELVSFITEKREQIAHWKTMSSIKTKKEVMHNEKYRTVSI